MVFSRDCWTEVFQSLRRNRWRTALTACGVFWGVFMLVVMLGFGRGLETGTLGRLAGSATNVVFIWGNMTTRPYKGHKPGRFTRLTVDDGQAIATQVKGVALVAPRNIAGGFGSAANVRRGNKSEGFEVRGDVPAFRIFEDVTMEQGRFLNPLDLAERRKVAVIGSRVRELLFEPEEDPIGQTLQIGNVNVTVVGVYRATADGARGPEASSRVLIPQTTFGRIYATGTRVNHFAILVDPHHSAARVEAEVKALLKRRHDIHPADPRAPGSFNKAVEYGNMRLLFLGIDVLTWIVGVLTLFAGALGVSNIMMITVAERTREFGIRKALGATPRSIVVQVVLEATVLTGLSGYTGLVVGVGVVEAAGLFIDTASQKAQLTFMARPELALGQAILAALALTVAGTLAGLAPARNAVAIRPVEALAHE